MRSVINIAGAAVGERTPFSGSPAELITRDPEVGQLWVCFISSFNAFIRKEICRQKSDRAAEVGRRECNVG